MATFRVEVDADHPVTSGVRPFDIHDELYILELLADVRVLLSAVNPEPAPSTPRSPLGWVRQHGQGKVCYLAPGHGPEQLEHPSVARLIAQALAWFRAG
jgi:type 1 glutamine amidotransferase